MTDRQQLIAAQWIGWIGFGIFTAMFYSAKVGGDWVGAAAGLVGCALAYLLLLASWRELIRE